MEMFNTHNPGRIYFWARSKEYQCLLTRTFLGMVASEGLNHGNTGAYGTEADVPSVPAGVTR